MEENSIRGHSHPYKFRRRRKFGFALLALVFVVAIGFVVMLLWNWLLPELFGIGTITYWQALGILLLSKILFGGGWFKNRSHGPGSWYWRRRFMKKWSTMSEEERNKIKGKFRSYCY